MSLRLYNGFLADYLQHIDAFMYLLRQNTNFRRWKASRVGFMCCSYTQHVTAQYTILEKDRRTYKPDSIFRSYGKGELPPDGRTNQVWGLDVDRIYVSVNINNKHWISLCISFQARTVEVIDCANKKYSRIVEAFANLIPRILKAVQSPQNAKPLKISPYAVTYVKVPGGLNKRQCRHCGPYALKYIECHVLELSLAVLDGQNIISARFKIMGDMLKATHDPIFINSMSKYVPPTAHTDPTVVTIN
uniref:Cysteine proteinase like protein n=1 Tax=Arabis alpina TaxID=50452 RepID=A0A097ZQN4_ARAAL|nr:cysteine proteinase like protein [Arabis alpina]